MEQIMLDMIPTGAKAVCHVSQYDIGRTIRFNLRSGGAAYTLSGTETVKVYIKKPDGTTAERNITNTSSTYVDWVTGEGDCDQAGKCECELVITSGTTVIGSKNFTVKIEEDPYNEQGVVTETAGPAVIATFTTNVVDLLQEVKCSINPIQNGTPWIDSNEVNKEPYIKRAVAGTASRIGNHLYDKLVGGTVPFNQLVKWETGTSNGLRATMDADGVVSISGTSTGGYANITSAVEPNDNHVYIFGRTIVANPNNIAFYWGLLNSNQTVPPSTTKSTGDSWVISKVNSHTGPSTGVAGFEVGTDFAGVKCKIIAIDLTAMFGSTIADYIYNLEFSTTGAGVAWFKALFPNDYYAYNAGELMSVKATAHIMRNASNTVIGNYALDSNLELRGIPKLVNNKLEYDGDTYESNGNVTRKSRLFNCAVDTFGVTKNVSSDNTDWLYYFTRYDISDDSVPTDVISQTFETVDYAPTRQNGKKCCLNKQFHVIYINMYGLISTNDEATAKQWLIDNAVKFLYKKTPTTETAQPFTNPQVCDENGTEEYTDNRAVAIPVGHETYQANICPITGFDELNVVQSGINIWDEQWEVGTYSVTTGQKYENSNTMRCKNPIVVIPNTVLYLKAPKTAEFLYYDRDMNYIGHNSGIEANKPTTIPSGVYYINFRMATSYGNTYNNDISINYPASDTQYHSYSGKLIKLEFDGTVYLAEVSCLNGVWKLKLLGAEYVVDSAAKIYRNTGNSWYADPTNGKHYATAQETVISDKFAQGQTQNQNVCFMHPNGLIRFNTAKSYDTASDLLADIGTFTFVYPLETPVEITLDETEQFEALIGINNVWHDGNGDTEVKYLYNA